MDSTECLLAELQGIGCEMLIYQSTIYQMIDLVLELATTAEIDS